MIENDRPAPTAESLMRSRYTAYTLLNNPYLKRTWHHTTCPTPLILDPLIQWQTLVIINTTAGKTNDSQGTVEFIAKFNKQGQQDILVEKSYFIKENLRWYYTQGDLLKIASNAACPCGSGKKFKRCCRS